MAETTRNETHLIPNEPEATQPIAPSDVETPRRALLHIVIGTLIFASIVSGYLWNAQRNHRSAVLLADARPLIMAGDAGNLGSVT